MQLPVKNLRTLMVSIPSASLPVSTACRLVNVENVFGLSTDLGKYNEHKPERQTANLIEEV